MSNSRVWSTKDIALAAYVSMRGESEGIALAKVERNGKDSEFFFRDPNEKVDEITMEYPRSESFKFDAVIRVLKSLGYCQRKRG